ncbi:MAG: M20 family metallopeptidase [Pseudomonadota bacterium]
MLNEIRSWVEIESQTADVDGVNVMMDTLSGLYRDMGAEVERIQGRDGRGDHLSIRTPWKLQGKYILILSHLDTVHPRGTLANDLPIRIDGDRAYGPGIYDMKSGAYLGYAAIRSLIQEGIETDLGIRILYTGDEEVGSPTSRDMIVEAAKDAAYVLVTEPARNGGKIVTARKGVGRFQVTAQGRPAHSGSKHDEGRSAIKELARHILDLEAMTDYERGVTINVGQIEGGTAENVVPQNAWMSVDLRVPTVSAGEEMVEKILSLKAYDPDVELKVTGGMNRPPFEPLPGTMKLYEHAKSIAKDAGWELKHTFTGGGSDGNFTAPYAPTLDGLGADGEGAHTLNEHIYISSLQPRFHLMRQLLLTLN